jgi:hypothetical protein
LVLIFSHFLVLGQHVHAGVNEWLTIRNLHRVLFKRLRICRYDARRGSGESQGSQPRPAAMGRASGNTGAIGLLPPLWFFCRTGVIQKKMLEPPRDRRRILSFAGARSLEGFRPVYWQRRIHL